MHFAWRSGVSKILLTEVAAILFTTNKWMKYVCVCVGGGLCLIYMKVSTSD